MRVAHLALPEDVHSRLYANVGNSITVSFCRISEVMRPNGSSSDTVAAAAAAGGEG